MADEHKFAAAVTAGRAIPRVLVMMGGNESTAPKVVPPSWGMDHAALEEILGQARMVENGRELAAQLKSIHGSAGYEVGDYEVFNESSHSAAQWHGLARGIPFAFEGTPAGD